MKSTEEYEDKDKSELKKEFDLEFDEFLCTPTQHHSYFEWFYSKLEARRKEIDSLKEILSPGDFAIHAELMREQGHETLGKYFDEFAKKLESL